MTERLSARERLAERQAERQAEELDEGRRRGEINRLLLECRATRPMWRMAHQVARHPGIEDPVGHALAMVRAWAGEDAVAA